ncbi:hypothetical protein SteCoe_1235 [Stentor coeruleus]|uniref:Uncharacterized protein n=1 Tax=Stentor coeruleus TaxID=5963 RepID=A0A1R2D264_9CILI|nr:hypothetical protein SteCoe_1235 [Stentor coeruleus]
MGSRSGTLFIRNQDKREIDISQLDYNSVINYLKREYRISNDCCIVLRNQNSFISTSYRWNEFRNLRKSKIIILNQVSQSISNYALNLSISKCIFKILNMDNDIVGLGAKISESFCICPKNIQLHDNFREFCRNYTIELFDGRTGNFLENGLYENLSNRKNEIKFFVCQISLNIEFLKMKLYDGIKGVKGDCIYFSKDTQMLEAFSYSRIHTDKSYYTLRNPEDCKTWLPGAIMFGKEQRKNENEDEDEDEYEYVIGIYYGDAGYPWYSMNKIVSQICDRYATSKDPNFKKAVLGLKTLRFDLDTLAPILSEKIKIDETIVKPRNKFTEKYN